MADDDWESTAAVQMAQLKLSGKPSSQPAAASSKGAKVDSAAGRPVEQPSVYMNLSAATTAAVASSHHDVPIDPVFLGAMDNPRERLALLKFEDTILRFMRNERETRLEFPPASSFHRLLVHRLAERFHLEHQSLDMGMATEQHFEVGTGRGIVLFKTESSKIPRTLFINLVTEKTKQETPTPQAPKILMKKRTGTAGAGQGAGTAGAKPSAATEKKSVEDRERAYAEARARIFGTESTDGSKGGSDSLKEKQKIENGMAKGPDGSVGFGGGRGKVAGQASAQPKIIAKTEGSGRGFDRPDSRAARKLNAEAKKNWRESKVTWRNREAEMNDPDFARNYDMYRPTFLPYRMVESSQASYLPPMESYGQPMMEHGYYQHPVPHPHMPPYPEYVPHHQEYQYPQHSPPQAMDYGTPNPGYRYSRQMHDYSQGYDPRLGDSYARGGAGDSFADSNSYPQPSGPRGGGGGWRRGGDQYSYNQSEAADRGQGVVLPNNAYDQSFPPLGK